MTLCSKCYKDMTDPETGRLMVGVLISGLEVAPISEEHRNFVRRQLGKYADFMGLPHMFCWECYLDSLYGVQKEAA